MTIDFETISVGSVVLLRNGQLALYKYKLPHASLHPYVITFRAADCSDITGTNGGAVATYDYSYIMVNQNGYMFDTSDESPYDVVAIREGK